MTLWIRGILRLIVAMGIAMGVPQRLAGGASDQKKDPDPIGKREVGSGVNLYSLEKEIALGRQLAQEVEKEARIVEAPHPAEFINRLAANLGRSSDAKVPITAKVIDSHQVNAFALPGGFLFVNTGMILRAETEAELASVMAHEIAHVAARHATRQASRGQIANIASLPLIFLGGWAGYAARQGLGLAVPLTFLKFSRGFEQEADLLGLQYSCQAGYDPTAFVDLLERLEGLERKKPGTLSDIIRSHPRTASRIQSMQKHIQETLKPQPLYVVSTSEFQAVKEEVQRMTGRRKSDPGNVGPTLRRAPPRGVPNEEDERPTLKRRPPS
jgi:predicted Zn-dependent protease